MFGFIRRSASVGEQTRMYKIGKSYGYLDALQELSQNIQVETQVRREQWDEVCPNNPWPGWDLDTFVRWLEGEILRMVRVKKESFDLNEITRLQESLESLANRRYRR